MTAAFYSKDPIIEAAWSAPQGWLLWGLAIAGAVLTGAYTFRLYFMVFPGQSRGKLKDYSMPLSMRLPLGILALASIGLGFVQFPTEWPYLPHLFLPWLSGELGMPTMPHGATAVLLSLLGMAAALLGIAWGWRLAQRELAGLGVGRSQLLASGLYLDAIYDALIVRPCFALSRALRDGIEAVDAQRGGGRFAGPRAARGQPRAELDAERQYRALRQPDGVGRRGDVGLFPVAHVVAGAARMPGGQGRLLRNREC